MRSKLNPFGRLRPWPTLAELLANTTLGAGGCMNWRSKSKREYSTIERYGDEWYVHRLTKALACDVACGAFFNHKIVFRHTCDNPRCINPKHIILGTQLDNIQDRIERKRTRHGDAHPYAKLCTADVRKIRALLREGKLQKQVIAKMFNIKPPTLSNIITGATWAHTKEE